MSLDSAILRIREMEQRFQRLLDAKNRGKLPEHDSDRAILAAYYESGLWLHDYQLDEQGLLPRNLKRGVLSEDGVYNFLADIDAARADSEAGL